MITQHEIITKAENEEPEFQIGELLKVSARYPIGHYRVPLYLRGKNVVVEQIIEPAAIDNEQEAFGRNAGSKRHYYRISIRLSDVWIDYVGSATDELLIEVFETWLERL